MKTYQKPVMIALSLTGNEQLCGSCNREGAIVLCKDPQTAGLLDLAIGNGDGTLKRSEFEAVFNSNFSTGDGCSKIASELEGYCKFTLANVIAWS